MHFKSFGIGGKLFGWPPPRIDPRRETAWLDGVRGVAAFLVMMNHYSMEWLSPFSDAPFGSVVRETRNPDMVWYYQEGDVLREIWRLPILRVSMCSGDAQVAVFFVLSGFVLSWSPLTTIRSGRYEKLYQALGSSTVRRWFRLYLPCFVVSTIYLVQRIVEYYHGIPGIFEEIWHFLKESEKWANPFDLHTVLTFTSVHPYNFVMWTIPFEFAGSVFIFVTLLSLGRIPQYSWRISAIVFISIYALISMYWGYWLFGSGLALADYIQQAGGFKKLSQRTSKRSSLLWSLALIVGLLLMGYAPPNEWYTTPGTGWLSVIPLPSGYKDMVGSGRFWWGWGGIFVVVSSCHLGFVRTFFELAIIQHLGRISFMLYLIHIFVDVVISKPLRSIFYERFALKESSDIYGSEVYVTTPGMNIMVHMILLLISISMSMCAAHFMEVYIEKPCTAFAKWIDDKLSNGNASRKNTAEEAQQLLRPIHAFDVELNEVIPR